MSLKTIRKLEKLFVALLFIGYIGGLLLNEDARNNDRNMLETFRLDSKDMYDSPLMHERIRKSAIRSVESEDKTTRIYHWESFLRTRELKLVTGDEGKLISKQESVRVKWDSVAVIFIPMLFFLGYILFRK